MDEEYFLRRLESFPLLTQLKGEEAKEQEKERKQQGQQKRLESGKTRAPSTAAPPQKQPKTEPAHAVRLTLQGLQPASTQEHSVTCKEADTVADLKDMWKRSSRCKGDVRCIVRGHVMEDDVCLSKLVLNEHEPMYFMPSVVSATKRQLPFDEEAFWPKLKAFCEVTYGKQRAASMMQTFKKDFANRPVTTEAH